MGDETRARVAEHTGDDTSEGLAGHLRRARRAADLSQREMASLVGVSPATVARAERGDGGVTLRLATSILAVAGFRLSVVDQNGEAVDPMRADAVRDEAGRRLPAHLDCRAVDPHAHSWADSRYDRGRTEATYEHRAARDRRRRVTGWIPWDHVTVADVASIRSEIIGRRRARWIALYRPRPLEPCTCSSECLDRCTSSCTCQCDP